MVDEWTTTNCTWDDALKALSAWLRDHDGWQYQLIYHPDYLVKKWQSRVFVIRGQETDVSINGRGDDALEAMIDMFNLADVQRPPATPTPVLLLNPRQAKLLRELGFPRQLMAITPDLLKEE